MPSLLVDATGRPLNQLSHEIISAGYEVHSALGSGLMEKPYQEALAIALTNRGFDVRTEVTFPVTFEGRTIRRGYRVDILVNDLIVVEVKTVERLLRVHREQVLTYLRHADKPLGLILNFRARHLRDGIMRVINGWWM